MSKLLDVERDIIIKTQSYNDWYGDISNTLGIISIFIQELEDERINVKYQAIFENPLDTNSIKNKKRDDIYSQIKDFLTKYSQRSEINLIPHHLRGEINLYIGMAFEKNLFGMGENHEKAFEFYLKSAEYNNPRGTFRVAQCYEKGIGKQKNIERAFYFYRCSAKLGLIDAMHTYGFIILFGKYKFKRDPEMGYFYLKAAARKSTHSYPFALYDIARCYEKGIGPKFIQSDNSYALKLYAKGASLDCPNCQYRLARCYEKGELDQEIDFERAIELYNKAAMLGQTDAQYTLSEIFLYGYLDAVSKNKTTAFFFALRASTQGHTNASFTVSEFYEHGIGVRKNLLLSKWWFEIGKEFLIVSKDVTSEREKIIITEKVFLNDDNCEMDGNTTVTGIIKAL